MTDEKKLSKLDIDGVKVTKFHQSYPYTGNATVEYTVGGVRPHNVRACRLDFPPLKGTTP